VVVVGFVVVTVWFGGQVITGGWVSLTVTVKVQLAVLPEASLTVQVTVVTPFGKLEPDAGLHNGVPTFGQLSVAVALAYVTTAVQRFASVLAVLFAGQAITGACVSLTVMVNVQVSIRPSSVAVQVTVVVPFGKNDPEAGEQTTVAIEQGLSTGAG
jgi:hypothetical protein